MLFRVSGVYLQVFEGVYATLPPSRLLLPTILLYHMRKLNNELALLVLLAVLIRMLIFPA